MGDPRPHVALAADVIPGADGCEECLLGGARWVHLRLCRICGHAGCCDQSPNRHARKHFHATGHAVIAGYDPPEGKGRCRVDEMGFDLSDRKTPHPRPIPRFVRPPPRGLWDLFRQLSPVRPA